MFLLSSSPVFLLTALLLGALLTYGEPCAPVIGEETLENQQTFFQKSETSATGCSTKEIENVAVVACTEKSVESQVVCTEERTFDSILHDTHHDEEKDTSLSICMDLCVEEFSEFANTSVIVETENQQQSLLVPSSVIVETEEQQQRSLLVPSNVIVKTEEQTEQVSENSELQEFQSINTESCYNEVHNSYQFGELMSSCWQPVMKQDPCSDSESDISGSSSDASMTDIIPMLDELKPSVNLGSGHPSSNFRESLDSSSDDEGDFEEDGDHGSDEGAQEKKNDGNKSEDNNDVDSLDKENVSNVDSLMERRRVKNILKFELDKRLMDMQSADTIQKMEEASRFRVQVPSISTPRLKQFDSSNCSEEAIELPQIPDSAPSVLLPWRKPFDIPFDQILDHERKVQETWTPRSYFPSTEHRKHASLYRRRSTYRQHHNAVMTENTEHACDMGSDSDSEETGNNGKLFGSLEAHIGEEIKIISAAISDACVLEANCEVDEGRENANHSDDTYSFCIPKSVARASEEKDLISVGSEKSQLCSLSNGNSSDQHIVEADSIGEVNLLFKCRMEEVPVQSISESGIGQPLTVEDELSATLSADSGMPAVEASSVEELNSRISLLTKETLTAAASDYTFDNELVQDTSIGALPAANGCSSQLPIEDGHEPIAMKFEGKPNELFTDYGEVPIQEGSSFEDMGSSFKKIGEEAQEQMPSSVHKFGQDEGETSSDMLILEAKSIDDIPSVFGQLETATI